MMLKPSAAPSVNQSSIRSAICSGVPAKVKWPRAPARLASNCRSVGFSRRTRLRITSEVILSLVRREKPTLRQLLASLAGARGHFTFAGTPEQVADLIEDWFSDGAADGFNVMPPVLPAMFDP